jgi:hypothetical protein
MGGILPEVCAFYFKSPPVEMEEAEALAYISEKWGYQEIAPQGADLPL